MGFAAFCYIRAVISELAWLKQAEFNELLLVLFAATKMVEWINMDVAMQQNAEM